jgi:hypothetical protein
MGVHMHENFYLYKLLEYSIHEIPKLMALPSPEDASSSQGERGGWHGASWSEACEYMRHGYRKESQKLSDIAREIGIVGEANQTRLKWKRSPFGPMWDVGKLNQGEPEAFFIPLRGKVKSKLCYIVFDLCAAYDVDPERIAARGRLTFILYRALEQSGFSVGLLSACCEEGYRSNDNKNPIAITLISIKRPGEFLDQDLAAYYLGHPALLRRTHFKLWELQDPEYRAIMGIGCNYGKPKSTVSVGYDLKVKLPSGTNYIYVPSCSDTSDNKQALTTAIGYANKAGIKLNIPAETIISACES